MLNYREQELLVENLREAGNNRANIRLALSKVADRATLPELQTAIAEAYVGITMNNSGYFIKSATNATDANAQAAKLAAQEIAASLKK